MEDSDNEAEITKMELGNNEAEITKMELGNNVLKSGELVTVADGEGQQYVVLEVIQLEDGSEQQVAVVAPDFVEEEKQGIFSLIVQ